MKKRGLCEVGTLLLWRRSAGLCAVGLLVAFLALYGWAKKEVHLIVDGKEREVSTFARTVADLLAAEGIALAVEDEVQPAPATPLREGLTVKVTRAGPVVLRLGTEERVVRTVPVTVRELLAGQGIVLGPEDKVEPSLEAVVAPGATVQVTRVSTREVVVTERIPFESRKEYLPDLAAGRRKVLQVGQDGLKRRVFQVTYVDGVPVKRVEVRTEVVRPPVPQVIGLGTRQERALHIAARGAPADYREVREMVATAYALHSATATGTKPRPGTVAVDPRVIPLGTRLYVEGYGYGRAEDVGSAIKGDRIDVYFNSEEEARRWGRRKVRVYILE